MENLQQAPAPLTDAQNAFLIKEFELLRTSVENAVGELRNLDRWVLVTTAAVWTWILTEHPSIPHIAASPGKPAHATPTPTVVFLVPVFIVVAFFLKAIAINNTLDLKNEYLREYVEAQIGLDRDADRCLGFETYFFRKRQQSLKNRTRVRMARIRAWSYGYYVALMVLYLAMAGWGMLTSR
jgi:hypothetical protein